MTSPFNPRDVEVAAAALPPQGANPIGKAARDVLTIHLKRATPGNYSQLFGTGPAFRSIFFAKVNENSYESSITPLTGLDGAFFAGFAVAVLCQQIYFSTSRLRPQMLSDQIAAALASRNSGLRQASYRFYAFMAGVADSPIRTALAAFPDESARAQARGHYLAGITSPTWVNDKLVQDASHNWPDRDWELFHHWIKLTALGATTQEIDSAISKVISMGLPVPQELGPGVWQARAPWFGSDIGGGDAADATGPILETNCHPVPGAFPYCMPEDNSFEFTASSQPGTSYRRPPSSSCFGPGTQVVMADGGLRPIELLGPGDTVRTPEGTRQVILRPAPRRGQRTLDRFDGTGIIFAASHPFLVHRGADQAGAQYAAADPADLTRSVPTLAQFGIRPLTGPRPPVLIRYSPDGDVPFPAPRVTQDHDHRPELLYDLYLEVGPDGRSEYYAGDEHTQLLVSSEVPRFAVAPETTEVILRVLRNAGPVVLAALADVPDVSFDDLLCIGLESLARTLMPAIGPQLRPPRDPALPAAARPGGRPAARDQVGGPAGREPAHFAASTAALDLAAFVCGFAATLADSPAGYDQRMGVLVEQFAARFAPQFQAALAWPWRTFDLAEDNTANILAVTPYSVELFQAGPQPSAGAELEVALVRGQARYTRRLPLRPGVPADRWYYTVDELAYFPEWAPPGPAAAGWLSPAAARSRQTAPGWLAPAAVTRPVSGAGPAAAAGSESWVGTDPDEDWLWQLEIALCADPGARAILPIPRVLDHGYQAFQAPVLDAGGLVVGQAVLDVRLLTTGGFADEIRASQSQDYGTDGRPADWLAELASDYISGYFARAVSAFRFCAATTTTP